MRKLIILLLLLSGGNSLFAQTPHDEEVIREAVFNYIESFYKTDIGKVYASVHPDLNRRSYVKRNNTYQEEKMSFRQMLSLSTRWSWSNPVPGEAPKQVTIFEVKDRIATAKVNTAWGTDYIHLVKVDDDWRIIHVMGQD